MARVLFQLLCMALTLTFFYYQNNAHILEASPRVDHAFPGKRIIVSDANHRELPSKATSHPDQWLLPVLDRLFTQVGLSHDGVAAVYFAKAQTTS